MNVTGFNDTKKLADARALAQSFKTGQYQDQAKKKNRFSQQWQSADAVRFVEVKEIVPPSKRHYNGDVLKRGWRIGSVSANTPVMTSAIDFLRRADQVLAASSESKADDMPNIDPRIPGTSFDSSASIGTADLCTPQSMRSEAPTGHQSRVNNDEANAETLAELLDSFSFKEATEVTEDASESILDTFLALLAEHTDLPPELEDVQASCVKRSKDTKEDDEPETMATLIQPDQHDSISGDSTASPRKNTPLSPKAKAFAPFEKQAAEENLPFTGQFNMPNDDGSRGFWPPMEHVVPTVPVTYTVWMPVRTERDHCRQGQPNMATRPAKPMQGLSTSKWAACNPPQTE